jgi:hypothetical protein
MCSIKDCNKPALAKGLCHTHYMRHRRTGNPNGMRKAGRKPDPLKATLRPLFSEYSERTLARYCNAVRRLQALGVGQGIDVNDPNSPYIKALKICTRPNGSVNVARLSQMADDWCALYRAGHSSATE